MVKSPLSQFAGQYREWQPIGLLRDYFSCVWEQTDNLIQQIRPALLSSLGIVTIVKTNLSPALSS
jgi:hypothetical protein